MRAKNRGELFEDFLVKFYNVAKADHFPNDSYKVRPDMIFPDGRKVQAKAYRGTVALPTGLVKVYKVGEASGSTINEEIYKGVRYWLDHETATHFALETSNGKSWEWVILTKDELNELTSTPTKAGNLFSLTTKKGEPRLKGKSMKKHLSSYRNRFIKG